MGYQSTGFLSGVPITIKDIDDIKNCDILVLPGGADIHPSLYGEAVGLAQVGAEPSPMDILHWEATKEAIRLGKGLFGICRGAQLLCAFAGGTLFQHVTGHGGTDHQIVTDTGLEFISNSCHHQAMRLDKRAVLLAQTKEKIATRRFDALGQVETSEPEVEGAWWPDINAVGLQGHPEWMPFTSPMAKYARYMIGEYLTV